MGPHPVAEVHEHGGVAPDPVQRQTQRLVDGAVHGVQRIGSQELPRHGVVPLVIPIVQLPELVTRAV